MGRQNAVRRAKGRPSQRSIPAPPCASDQKLAPRKRSRVLSRQFASSNKRLKQLPTLMLCLLQHYTPLVWVAAVSIVIGCGTAAITTILDPDASVPYSIVPEIPEAPEVSAVPSALLTEKHASNQEAQGLPPSAFAAQPENLPTYASQNSDRLPHSPPQRKKQSENPISPQSAVGAIALSCAAGCFLLSRWLQPKRPAQRRILWETAAPSSRKTQLSSQGPPVNLPSANPLEQTPATLNLPASDPPLLAPSLPTPHPTPAPQPSAARSSISFDLIPSQLQAANSHPDEDDNSTAVPAEVTLLSAEQGHPLDWNEPSLADNLDLRRSRPLSYWL